MNEATATAIRKAALGAARTILGNDADAEDIAQETILEILEAGDESQQTNIYARQRAGSRAKNLLRERDRHSETRYNETHGHIDQSTQWFCDSLEDRYDEESYP